MRHIKRIIKRVEKKKLNYWSQKMKSQKQTRQQRRSIHRQILKAKKRRDKELARLGKLGLAKKSFFQRVKDFFKTGVIG
jgi:hypothetical protein